jgi:hypothetical protein
MHVARRAVATNDKHANTAMHRKQHRRSQWSLCPSTPHACSAHTTDREARSSCWWRGKILDSTWKKYYLDVVKKSNRKLETS